MGGSVSDRPRVRTVWWVVFYTSVGIVLAVGILLLAEAWLPYPQVKLGIDALAPDGQVESFTLARYLQLRPFAIGFGLGFLIAGGLALAFIARPRRVWLSY